LSIPFEPTVYNYLLIKPANFVQTVCYAEFICKRRAKNFVQIKRGRSALSFLPFFFLSAIPGFNPDIQTTDCRVKPDNDRKEREKPDYDKNKKNGHDKKEKAGFLPPFQNVIVLS